MNRRALNLAAAGTIVVLMVLGIHEAWVWERDRYHLHTPKGTIRIGMTQAEVWATLGRSRNSDCFEEDLYLWGNMLAVVYYDRNKRIQRMDFAEDDNAVARIPRPSFVVVVRSWLTGKGEE